MTAEAQTINPVVLYTVPNDYFVKFSDRSLSTSIFANKLTLVGTYEHADVHN